MGPEALAQVLRPLQNLFHADQYPNLNRDAYARHVDFVPGISEETQMLLFTPETSGGLLVAVPPERLETLIGLFADEGQPGWVIGEVVDGEGIEVII